jgi:hypothetical protein
MPKKAGSWDTNNLKKEFKTIYDMISNLAGRSVPGIPINAALRNQRVYHRISKKMLEMLC